MRHNSNMPLPKLPSDLEIIQELGSGRRSQVYMASYEGRDVAVKVYKPEYIDKYQSQYKVNIAEFEFERNQRAKDSQTLSQYIAKPYKLLKPEEGYALAFVQEYVDGVWMEDLMARQNGLPSEVLQTGYYIVKEAAKLGLYDLDIPPGNIRLKQDASGKWYPKLYDFNLMPQHQCPPNPFMALGFKLGLRSKNHRDYRSLKHWQYLSEQARAKQT